MGKCSPSPSHWLIFHALHTMWRANQQKNVSLFFPLLLGGKYQLELCEQWVIHLAQDQGNSHLKTFHSAIILQLRSLTVRMDGWRKRPVWAFLCTTFPGALSACLSCFPLCPSSVHLAHTQMFNLRMVSSSFSAHIWVASPLATTWLILGSFFRTVSVSEAALVGPCTYPSGFLSRLPTLSICLFVPEAIT